MSVSYSAIKEKNEEIFDGLQNPGLEKRGEQAVSAFTRTTVREDGIMDKIIPSVPIADSEFTRSVQDDRPMRVVDREPGGPAAVTVPFSTRPREYIIVPSRYEVPFGRIMTRRFIKDTATLRTYDMDIRQVMSDNSIRDMMAEKDSKWFDTVEAALGDAPGVVLASSGMAQWQILSGGIDRDNVIDALAIMPQTPGRWVPTKVVVNNLFIYQLLKFGRDEAGGDLSEEWLKNGWSGARFAGVDWIASIKHDIIPNNTMYMFADEIAIGKHFELEPLTMSVKVEYFMTSWFSYAGYGAAIGNTSGLAIAQLT